MRTRHAPGPLAWPVLAVALMSAPAPGGEPAVLAVDADGVQRAAIKLDSYSYVPDHLVVQAGKAVELTLSNVSSFVPHNLVLDEGAAGFKLKQDVGAGNSTTLHFTPLRAGTFRFYCDKKLLFFPSHREQGMEGTLEVR